MGWGDELMAAGHAARVSREAGGAPVNILDRDGRVRHHELWEGLDFIKPVRTPGAVQISNGPGCRPYILYPFSIEGGQRFSGWRARDHRPVIASRLSGDRWNEGFVYIEPTVKAVGNPNKRWHGWQAVVEALPEVTFVQCGPREARAQRLAGANVHFEETDGFIEAVRRLNQAAIYAGTEGGMHHAAAALNVPAVVVFGGAVSIDATGYQDHRNFGTAKPCGSWKPCKHCAEVMAKITPEMIVYAIKEKLQ